MARKIATWGKNLTGTSPYWWGRREEVAAAVQHKLFHENELPIAFHSGSMAEYHWQDLHQILHEALLGRGADGETIAAIKRLAEGNVEADGRSGVVHKVLLQNSVLINQVFVLRTKAWFGEVLGKAIGIEDYWYRFEFAKSRGAIHFHAILYKASAAVHIHALLDRALAAANMEQLEEEETKVASELPVVLADVLLPLTALHPAGRQRSGDGACETEWYRLRTAIANSRNGVAALVPEDASRELHFVVKGDNTPAGEVGNVDRWVGHEGTAEKPSFAPLRKKIFQVMAEFPVAEERGVKLLDDLIDFSNLVLLHCCSSYCLRVVKRKRGEGEEEQKLVLCRMHYGEENAAVKARTDGKAVRNAPALVTIKGVTYLLGERDHPRFVQGSAPLARGWCANLDFQPVLASLNDIPTIDPTEFADVLEWCEAEEQKAAELATSAAASEEAAAEAKAQREVFASRRYFNREEYCSRLIDYCVAYACKGEVSSNEAVLIFHKLIHSKNLPTSTSFKSLAQRLNMKVLQSREVPDAEAAFCLQGLQHYHSSFSFNRVSLAVGERAMADGTREGDEDPITGEVRAVRANAFDKFRKKKADGELEAATTFHAFNCSVNAGTSNRIPVYTNGAQLRATWPLTEKYARTMLLLHKPSVRKFADVKGDHDSFVAALEDFLRSGGDAVPPGMVRAIQRECLAFCREPRRSQRGGGGGGRARRGGRRGQDDDDEGEMLNTPADEELGGEADGAAALFGEDLEVDLENANIREAEVGYVTDTDKSLYPSFEEMAKFLEREAESFYSGNVDEGFNLPRQKDSSAFVEPLWSINNVGQRRVLTRVLEFVADFAAWCKAAREGRGPEPKLWGQVAGVAGTGKSFIMQTICAFVKIFRLSQGSVSILAPTGAAAGQCGGTTVDRALSFSRTRKEYVSLAQSKPMKCAELQERNASLFGMLIDEISMWGQLLFGHTARSVDEIANEGLFADAADGDTPSFGGLPLVLVFGDHKQLPPVLDRPLPDDAAANAVAQFGHAAYAALEENFVLTQPVRQNAGGRLIKSLTHLRDGTAGDDANVDGELEFLGSRRLAFCVTSEEDRRLWGLPNNETLVATCYNKDRDEVLLSYIEIRENMHVVRARVQGTHAVARDHAKAGMVKAIQRTNFVSVGMMVKLKVNFLPERGLYNNARGIIRDILYPGGLDGSQGYNPEQLPILLIEFKEYTGAPMNSAMGRRCVRWREANAKAQAEGSTPPKCDCLECRRRLWVPVAPIKRVCDCRSCSREGPPVVCAKADSVHSCQGLTGGDDKALKRIILRWNAQAEALWPGILYVGASRPEKEHNFALDFDISRSDLKKVGASARWRKQHAEVERIHEAARVLCETNESLDERSAVGDATECPWGSRQDFFFRLTSFCLSAKAQLDAKQDLGEAIKKEVEDCLGQWQASLRQELSTWSEEDRAKWAPTFEANGWVEFLGLDEGACTKRRRVWSSSSGEDSDNNKNKKFKSSTITHTDRPGRG